MLDDLCEGTTCVVLHVFSSAGSADYVPLFLFVLNFMLGMTVNLHVAYVIQIFYMRAPIAGSVLSGSLVELSSCSSDGAWWLLA